MSLNTDLQTLKTNIECVKSTLYTNLTNKGVTNISETDTLTTLAEKVSTITVGEGGSGGSGFDFSPIGYDAEFSTEVNSNINSDIAYSKSLYDSWNPSNTSSYNFYKNDKNIVYAPNIDTSNVTDMEGMFHSCVNLKTVPFYYTSNVKTMQYMFYNCSSIKKVPAFDTSNVTTMRYMFSGCTSITSIPELNTSNVTDMYHMLSSCISITSVPAFDTSKVTNMNYIFDYCISLTSVPELDTSKATGLEKMFQTCPKLTTIEGISFKSFKSSTMSYSYMVGYSRNTSIRKAVFKDIGYQSTAVQFNTSYIDNWGVNTDEIPDARQSLIDSLITYSFDRASAGYPTCTITLSSATKALLTSDEIAQITAKGFTLA